MRCALLLAAAMVAAAAAAATDLDFEFDDNQEMGTSHLRRPRRYVYDPNNNNELCAAVSCGARSVCVVRRGRARCVPRPPLRPPSESSPSEEDVFYESREDPEPAHCVGCGAEGGAGEEGFLCGSDNRTYSSLCRLDLHNCVRRARPPVTLACHGFCPCALPARPRRPPRRNHDKLRQYSHEESRRRLELQHNEVLPDKEAAALTDEGCSLESMASRLLDWAAVLMAQATHAPARALLHHPEFPSWCPREVRWMFSHLDADADGVLSAQDLYALQHDERERCLRPFLASCGVREREGEGEGEGATRVTWCGCLRHGARPCTRLARAHPHPPPGAYVPRCDARGWYLPRQCHGALRQCWCVDRRGVERPGSRAKGHVRCPRPPDTDNDVDTVAEAELEDVAQKKQDVMSREGEEEEEGAEGAPADDEDGGAGSGGGPADQLY